MRTTHGREQGIVRSNAEPPSDWPKSVLTDECGHHCGKKDNIIGHCPCRECHGFLFRSVRVTRAELGLEEQNGD